MTGSGEQPRRHWIFGYGSLIFRPDYGAHERRLARLPGFVRRFFQGSPDHRGTPEAPGRVVTLVPDAAGEVYGVASLVDVDETMLATLDVREAAGYQRQHPAVTLDDGRVVNALVYYAAADNPHYLGDAPLDTLAAHIAGARGPSGDNADYLFQLDDALRHLGVDDPHVRSLASAVRAHLHR